MKKKITKEEKSYRNILNSNYESLCAIYCDHIAKNPADRMASNEELEELRGRIEVLRELIKSK